MKNIIKIMMVISASLFLNVQSSFAFEEASYSDVMNKLESKNEQLFKMAEKVYTYATTNTSEIIKKPLLTRHNKGLNAVIDLDNKVSAKYYGVGSDGLKSKLVMLFRFNGEKYKVVKNYSRKSKFSKWMPAD